MSETSQSPAPLPEFSRKVEVARLKGTEGDDFDLVPDAAETASLARLLGASRLSKVRFRGAIRPFGKGEWQLSGHLGATVVQPCVVTLAPVTTRIEADVHRQFVHRIALAGEVELDPESDFDLELLGSEIDLGAIAAEELALNTPEYPRAPGAELKPPLLAAAEDEDADDRPFNALRALRDRLSDT